MNSGNKSHTFIWNNVCSKTNILIITRCLVASSKRTCLIGMIRRVMKTLVTFIQNFLIVNQYFQNEDTKGYNYNFKYHHLSEQTIQVYHILSDEMTFETAQKTDFNRQQMRIYQHYN